MPELCLQPKASRREDSAPGGKGVNFNQFFQSIESLLGPED